MALTKVNGEGVGTLSSGLTLTSDDPTITMTDSSGTNDIATLQATSGALIITARDGSADGEIIFKKTDGSATDETMRITNSGHVGIGESSPTQALHVDEPTSNNQAAIIHSSLSTFQGQVLKVTSARATTNSSYNLCLMGADKFAVRDSGNVVNANNSYGQLSDQRLKENITDASSQWDDIKALKVRNFNFIDDDLTQIGVVAQEVETAGMSGLVEEAKLSEPDADGNDVVRKNVKYSVLYMKAVKALQEAMTRIEALETKVAALEGS